MSCCPDCWAPRARSWRLESVGAKRWGDNSVENYGAYVDFLVKNGLLKEKAATTDLITNDLIDDINKFDLKDIVRGELNPPRETEAVHRSPRQRFQDDEVQRSVQKIDRCARHDAPLDVLRGKMV